MKRAFLAGALGAAILTSPAKADPRLVERLYNPDEVVRIEGRVNVQATIKFGQDEHIENVAIGDSNAWQVTPNKRANILFVKPLDPKAATNMTVVTDRHAYVFDLVASGRGRPLYVLAFKYPEPIEPEPALSKPAERASPVEMAAVNDPYAVVDPSQLNFAWAASGAPKLLPTSAFDDGEATFLAWPQGTPVPAILTKDHDGTEGPVNFAVRGETIVIDGVPRAIVLRSGKDSALLLNNGPVRDPAAPELARAGKVK